MIRIVELSKRFSNKVLFNSQTYQFPVSKKIAIVGDNGTGKSTLLNILCGLEHADSGEVLRANDCSLGYLPQEPNQNPKNSIVEECESSNKRLLKLHEKMNAALLELEKNSDEKTLKAFEEAETQYNVEGGYELRSKAEKILIGLGFDKTQLLKSPKTLSGGWRMRVELAKLFLINPDILILDEPTNHLDLPSLAWVEKYLESFQGTLIFVSHDRHLLNRLANHTVHIAWGHLYSYAGNYDFFLEKQLETQEIALKTYKNLKEKRDSLQVFVDRFGAKATKAAQAQSKSKMIAKLEKEMETLALPRKESSIHFELPPPPSCDRAVIDIENGSIGYANPLCKNIELHLEKGQKIAVIGANGIGKSTLLKSIVGVIPPLGGNFRISSRAHIAYFSQDQLEYLAPQQTVLENLLSLTAIGEREARSILGAFLFQGEDVFKPISVLSGGEKNRVGLACILAKKANLIILDEPTNHLDMKSIECLKEALKHYQGTLLFVSHDRDFIDSLCSHVFVMTKDSQTRLFEGDIEDYQRLASKAGFPNVFEAEEEHAQKVKKVPQKKQKAQAPDKKLKKKLKDLEKEIDSMSKKIQDFEEDLLKYSSDHKKCFEIAKEKSLLEDKKEDLENTWLSLQEEE